MCVAAVLLAWAKTRKQRAGLLAQFANMERPPESVPINLLTQVEGTPLHGTEALDPFEFCAHHCRCAHRNA
jgi:biotin synthase